MPAKKAAKPVAKKAEKKEVAKPTAKAAAPAKKTAAASDRGVYVKGLNFPDMDHETVKAAFKQCGDVKDVVLRRKKYCILYFKDSAGAAKAKELNGKVMKGSKITVEAAKRKPDQDRSEYCSSVFVGNLPGMLRKQGKASLKKEFSKCGKVEKVRIYQTGHGFVYFSDNAAAKKAATTMDHQ
eukprot:gene21157-32593_t